jgi:hypothetical protein
MPRRHNPLSRGEEMTLAVLGVLAAGVLGWMYINRDTLTLAPGNQSLKVAVPASFTLKLPGGASWISVAAGSPSAMPVAALTSGNAPMVMPSSSAGEMVVAMWRDSNGATQTSTVTITS